MVAWWWQERCRKLTTLTEPSRLFLLIEGSGCRFGMPGANDSKYTIAYRHTAMQATVVCHADGHATVWPLNDFMAVSTNGYEWKGDK